MLLSTVIENTKAFESITDDEGYLVVPEEKWSDFCGDMGVVIARVLQRATQASENENNEE